MNASHLMMMLALSMTATAGCKPKVAQSTAPSAGPSGGKGATTSGESTGTTGPGSC
jgi:hypothetical protein